MSVQAKQSGFSEGCTSASMQRGAQGLQNLAAQCSPMSMLRTKEGQALTIATILDLGDQIDATTQGCRMVLVCICCGPAGWLLG